jgi:isoamylase
VMRRIRHSAGRSSPAPNAAPPERRLAQMGRTTTTGGINSWNCSAEGPTDHPRIVAPQPTILATLLLSQRVPMLPGADEFGRNQGGNSNAYCQDNEVSWLDWESMGEEGKDAAFLPQADPTSARAHCSPSAPFLHGQTIPGTEVKGIVWLRPDGAETRENRWANRRTKTSWCGSAASSGSCILTERGEQEPDDTSHSPECSPTTT